VVFQLVAEAAGRGLVAGAFVQDAADVLGQRDMGQQASPNIALR
jgi:hypothetical protein